MDRCPVPPTPPQVELDLGRYELRVAGRRRHLERLPMELLILLQQSQPHLVTREEIISRLWGDGVHLDTDQSINNAIRKIRLALGDDPERPAHIQTVVGKGYRLITPIRVIPKAPGPESRAEEGGQSDPARRTVGTAWRNRFLRVGAAAVLVSGIAAAGVTAWRTRHPAAARLNIKSLAVLPLDNLSGDAKQDYFADGMTDELITDLARISSLRVVSRASVMRYRGKHEPIPQIGRELGVDAVVEGSVVRAGGRVRVTAQLIEAADDRHLWAESYDRNLSDVLAVQGEVAEAIAEEVQTELTAEDRVQLLTHRAVAPDAYDEYLRGRHDVYSGRSEDILRQAVRHFEAAAARSPDYAPTYAGLAAAYSEMATLYLPPRAVMPAAREAAEQALALDGNLAEAHAWLGNYKLLYEWDWLGAEKELQRALQLNPSSADAHVIYSKLLISQFRFDEAIQESERAQKLDPLSVRGSATVGLALFFARRYDEAIRQGEAVAAKHPNAPQPEWLMSLSYAQKRQYREAIRYGESAARINDSPFVLASLAGVYAQAGENAKAQRLLWRVISQMQSRYVCSYEVAAAYIPLRRYDKVYQWLNKAYEDRSDCMIYLQVDPRFDPLRSDSRFRAMVRKMRFPS